MMLLLGNNHYAKIGINSDLQYKYKYTTRMHIILLFCKPCKTKKVGWNGGGVK